MGNESQAHLYDILQAVRSIKDFVSGRTFAEYASDELLRSAVERKFEIVGEALNRVRRDDPDLLLKIRSQRDIISYRNILVHGYDAIDDRIVWGVIEADLDNVIEDVARLLQ